jgi:hypothetical protein
MDSQDGLLLPTILILVTLTVVHFASYNMPLIAGDIKNWQRNLEACADTTCVVRHLSMDTRERIHIPLDKPLVGTDEASRDWGVIKEAFTENVQVDPPLFYQRIGQTTVSTSCGDCVCEAQLLAVVENFTWAIHNISDFQCQCQ